MREVKFVLGRRSCRVSTREWSASALLTTGLSTTHRPCSRSASPVNPIRSTALLLVTAVHLEPTVRSSVQVSHNFPLSGADDISRGIHSGRASHPLWPLLFPKSQHFPVVLLPRHPASASSASQHGFPPFDRPTATDDGDSHGHGNGNDASANVSSTHGTAYAADGYGNATDRPPAYARSLHAPRRDATASWRLWRTL